MMSANNKAKKEDKGWKNLKGKESAKSQLPLTGYFKSSTKLFTP
jgi:hypothetical protein